MPSSPQDSAALSNLSSTLDQDADSVQRSIDLSTLMGEAPSTVPGYRILKPIGEGKYGSVWLAREQNTGKYVAIKFYTHRRGVDWSLLGREVEKLAVLYTSRNIVGLLAVGWDHDPPYYVMEYLENGSLAAKLAAGPLSPLDAIRIATRVCQALVHAHGSGILHCDLKPANILLDQDFEPRLCDFGQSRLADEHSHALGTLFYMAPEQADLKAVPDARWDVYALGALIYNMLTGAPPFRTEENEHRLGQVNSLEDRLTIYRHIVRSGSRPSLHRRVAGVDQQLAEIVDRCLASDPAKRFPNAQAVLDRLVARERFRARRPLILLGLILPILLLLCIAPLAMKTISDAVRITQSSLTRRAVESDKLSVHLLADIINRELEDRQHDLEALVDEEHLRQLIAKFATSPTEERQTLIDRLNRLKRENDDRLKRLGRLPDASWFLLDASGIQRWRSGLDLQTDESYAWRDYFHGLHCDYPPTAIPVDNHPIHERHISIPYKATSTGLYVIALSVPVFDPDDSERVIGVFARTLTLGSLIEEYERNWQKLESDGVNRKLAILDSYPTDGKRYWQLLAHSWMTDRKLGEIPIDDFRRLRLVGIAGNEEVIRDLEQLVKKNRKDTDTNGQEGVFDRTSHYVDPVHQFDNVNYGGKWLAAFSQVGKTEWFAVVQEREDAVLRPVEELQARMLTSAIGGVMVVFGLVAGSWWMIVTLLNERAPRWLRFWRTGSSAAGTNTMSLTAKGIDSGG